jgi:Colicin V production protein.
VCAIFGAEYIKEAFAKTLSGRFVQPFIFNKLSEQLEKLGLTDAVENLTALFNNLKLPQFLQNSVAEQVAGETAGANSAIDTAVTSASLIIAERVTGWLLLILSFIVIYMLIKLLFDGMLDPVIRKLPLVSQANSLLGAVLGGATGVLLAGLLLVIIYKLVPSLSAGENSIFAPKTVESTYLLKLYFKALPGVFS